MSNIVVYIYYKNSIMPIDLFEYQQKSDLPFITIGRSDKNNIYIDDEIFANRQMAFSNSGDAWILEDLSGTDILVASQIRVASVALSHGTVFMTGNKNEIIGIAYEKSASENVLTAVKITDLKEFTIGNSHGCHFQIIQKNMPAVYIELARREDNSFYIKNHKGRLGFLNNKENLTQGMNLIEGSDITVLGLRFSIGMHNIRINGVGELVRINHIFRKESLDYKPYIQFRRVPREIPEIPLGKVIIKDPNPKVSEEVSQDINMLISPLIFMGGMVIFYLGVTKFGNSSYNPIMMIGFSMISLVNGVSMFFVNKITGRKNAIKQNLDRITMYRNYLNNVVKYLEEIQEKQRYCLGLIHPSMSECEKLLSNSSYLMWNRLPIHSDFLEIRFGFGKTKFSMEIESSGSNGEFLMDELVMEGNEIRKAHVLVDKVPVCLSLEKYFAIGIHGQENKLLEVSRAMIVNLSFHHSYTEVKFVFALSEKELPNWDWVKWLPHCWDDRHNKRFIASDPKGVESLLNEIGKIIMRREEELSFSGNSKAEEKKLPHYIFFFTDASILDNCQISRYLYKYNNPKLGFSSIFLCDNYSKVPPNCTAIISAKEPNCEFVFLDDAIGRQEFVCDNFGDDENINDGSIAMSKFNAYSRKMASLRLIEVEYSSAMPEIATLLDVFDVDMVEDLNIISRWSNNKAYKGLEAPIGFTEGRKVINIDLSERQHGPHGLIAGTTGSGKSELIQSLVLSLSVNYSPRELAFLFVDFKGGATTKIFENIPHNMGILTNIEDDNLYQINRAMASLRKEIEERQELLQKPYDNIDSYQRAFFDGDVETIIPHLIIIVDEFAELKTEFPDFIEQLISISRVGRSLGIHLILATQKPAGIVNNQIWSNSKFKICLKVQDRNDSMDVLRKPDAADIIKVGQAYLQVGNNEVYELFQSAWSGSTYDYSSDVSEEGDILEVALDGTLKKYSTEINKNRKNSKSSQLSAIVEAIEAIGVGENFNSKIWLQPLGQKYYLKDLIGEGALWSESSQTHGTTNIAPVIGVGDDVCNKKQELVTLNFKKGHILIYGAPGSGKTTFIYTVITALIKSYSPLDVSIYIVDFGSKNITMFEGAAHVGGIVLSGEDEKFNRLIKFLKQEIEYRKRIFVESGCLSWEEYRKNVKSESKHNFQGYIVVVDNFQRLKEQIPDLEEILSVIIRESGNYGIYFLVNIASNGQGSYRFLQNFVSIVMLRMQEKSAYREILGKAVTTTPANYQGRGFLAVKDETVVEFQTALPLNSENEENEGNVIREMIEQISSRTIERARPIPILPDEITALYVKKIIKLPKYANKLDQKGILPIGVNYANLEPIVLDINNTSSFLVSGKRSSGKTNFLANIIIELNQQYSPDELDVFVFEDSKEELKSLCNLPVVKCYASNNDEDKFQILIRDMMSLVESKTSKNTMQILIIDNFLDFFAEAIKASEQSDLHNKLTHLMKYGIKNGIRMIIASASNEISNAMSNVSVRQLIDGQNGLVMGGSVGEHRFSCDQVPYAERNKVLLKGDGFLISRESCLRIKMIKYLFII